MSQIDQFERGRGPGTDRQEKPRIVLLTSGTVASRRVAVLLAAHGVHFELLTVSYPPPRRGRRTIGGHILNGVRAHVASLGPLRRIRQRHLPRYPVRPQYVGMCNRSRLLHALRCIRPDYILLMGGGILSKETIASARVGVINAHPGLLPWIRGLDVIRHAVARRNPIGVTGHFIDEGIDTGDTICRYLLPVTPVDDFHDLSERAENLCCAVMVDLACRVWQGETLPRLHFDRRYRYCGKMSRQDAEGIDGRIARGDAYRIFRCHDVSSSELLDGGSLLAEYRRWWGHRPVF